MKANQGLLMLYHTGPVRRDAPRPSDKLAPKILAREATLIGHLGSRFGISNAASGVRGAEG